MPNQSKLIGSYFVQIEEFALQGAHVAENLVLKANMQAVEDTNEAYNKKSHAQTKEAR